MQRRVAIWILRAFKISPTEEIEAITGLLPIKLHLQKLAGRLQLHATSFPMNHIIWTLMDSFFGSPYNRHPSSLDSFTKWQRANIKGHLVNLTTDHMDCFLFSLWLILNSFWVLELLTIFQIDFLSIFSIIK